MTIVPPGVPNPDAVPLDPALEAARADPRADGERPVEHLGSIDLLPDGRMRIRLLDGTPIQVRRPSIGEFRRLRIQFAEAQGDYRDDFRAANEEIGRLTALEETGEIPTDIARAQLAEIAERLNESRARFLDLCAAWWRDLSAGSERLGPMCSPPLPAEADDWPVDLIEGKAIFQRILDHWTYVPSAPGSGDRPAPRAT